MSVVPGPRLPVPLLAGYPPALQARVRSQLAAGTLGAALQRSYPEAHTIRTDGALYAHASALKARYLAGVNYLGRRVAARILRPTGWSGGSR